MRIETSVSGQCAFRAASPCVLAGCMLGVLLAGCTLGPDYQRPALDIPTQFRSVPAATGSALQEGLWWQSFGDPVLDSLVAEGLAHSQDLAAAAARVEQFYGALGSTRAQLFPQLGAQLDGSRSRASERSVAPAPSRNPYNAVQANLLASWEIDLFGRTRRLTEAATAELWASEAARQGAVLSLVAAIVSGYVQLCNLDQQLKVARETLEARQGTLTLFEKRFRGGVVSELELSQARSEYAAALGAVPTLAQSVAQQENALSVLIGRNPGPIARGRGLDQLVAPTVPAGLPSELLERRPDIVQAEQSLMAANARIGAARAAYFPNISLTGAFGAASTSLNGLWSGSARAWSYGAALAMPLFTAGAVAGQVLGAEAAQRESLARYRKAVQTAFGETEDALVGVLRTRETREAQSLQVLALGNYARLARKRYEGGYTSYLEVLDAERAFFNAQIQLAQARSDVLLQSVALYKALGGDWVAQADRQAPQPGVNLDASPRIFP